MSEAITCENKSSSIKVILVLVCFFLSNFLDYNISFKSFFMSHTFIYVSLLKRSVHPANKLSHLKTENFARKKYIHKKYHLQHLYKEVHDFMSVHCDNGRAGWKKAGDPDGFKYFVPFVHIISFSLTSSHALLCSLVHHLFHPCMC